MSDPATTARRTFFSGTSSDDLVVRGEVMWLIERELERWSDSDPPRHALSVLWGEVRDMKDFETALRERVGHEQHQSTVST